jgi:hypothetical protein
MTPTTGNGALRAVNHRIREALRSSVPLCTRPRIGVADGQHATGCLQVNIAISRMRVQ